MRATMTLLGGRHGAAVLDDEHLTVRYGLGFRARLPRSSLGPATRYAGKVWSSGVHGWRGRWLVNGSSRGIVVVPVEPAQRAHVLGWPISLRELLISLDDPDGFVAALA